MGIQYGDMYGMGIQYGDTVWAYNMGLLEKLNEVSFPVTVTNMQPKCR